MGLSLGFGLGPLRASIPLSGGHRGRSRPRGPNKAELRDQAVRDVMAWFAIVPVRRVMGGHPDVDREVNRALARGELGAAARGFVRGTVRIVGDFPTTYVNLSNYARHKVAVTEALRRPPVVR
jgi:hypothetical protein